MKKLTFLMLIFPVLLNAQTVIVLDVNQPPKLNFEFTQQDTTILSGDSVKIGTTININGGSGEYNYSWSPAQFLDDFTRLSPVAFPSDSTNYFLTVTDTAKCSFVINFNVNVSENTMDIQESNIPDNRLSGKIYPNPNIGRFKVELTGRPNAEINLTIVDILGKVVYQNVLKNFNGKHTETLTVKFPKGIYNLIIHSEDQKLQYQFVIN